MITKKTAAVIKTGYKIMLAPITCLQYPHKFIVKIKLMYNHAEVEAFNEHELVAVIFDIL
jgi:hypothetical protein